jgi:hypothetical protein
VRGFDPVAITMALPSTVSTPPAPSTSSCHPAVPWPTSRPWPLSQVILFLRNRNSMPLVILVTIASLRAIIRATSIFAPLTVMPCSPRPDNVCS